MKSVLKTDIRKFSSGFDIKAAKKKIDDIFGIDVVIIDKDEELQPLDDNEWREKEIKIQIAKDIYCAWLLTIGGEVISHEKAELNADTACNTADYIFNRFNK